MCGRFDTSHLTWKQIHDQLSRFHKVASTPFDLQPNNDVRPTTRQLTARIENGAFVVEPMRWGLIPAWRSGKPLKDTSKGAGDGFKLTTFNCRGEEAASKPVFRNAFARKRCIVPANAWFEWTEEQGGKVKHRFARKDGQPLWFGGLWDHVATSDEGSVYSFSIVTQESEGSLRSYHTRSPLVLEPEDWDAWLKPDGETPAPALPPVGAERFVVES